MKATLCFAAAVFVAAGSALAADDPVGRPAPAASVPATAGPPATSAKTTSPAGFLPAPAVPASKGGARTRAQVHAEAVDSVKNHKPTLSVELEYYK